MRPEQRSPQPARSKSGLETPLFGRFIGENRYLIFAPPKWYEILMGCCLVLGPVQALLTTAGVAMPLPFLQPSWVGIAVFLAGLWALLSSERLIVAIGEGTYVRQETGLAGLKPTRGKITEFDALVAIRQGSTASVGGGSGVLRLVLHWKDQRHPPLIVERINVSIPAGFAASQAAGPLLQKASLYGKALGIPVYNNTQDSTPSPLKPF